MPRSFHSSLYGIHSAASIRGFLYTALFCYSIYPDSLIFKTLHINFTAYLFLCFKINRCLSAVFTSSGLLRKNREHPLIFHLLDEALRFHVQAHIFLHELHFLSGQLYAFRYTYDLFSYLQECNSAVLIVTPFSWLRFHRIVLTLPL